MSESRAVYSTDQGRLCPGCGAPVAECRCKQQNAPRSGDGIVRVSRETKGRKGKGVTLVSGLPLTDTELRQVAKQLKQLCGTGGTLKDGVIEIQGDQRDRLCGWLEKQGHKVKRAGG